MVWANINVSQTTDLSAFPILATRRHGAQYRKEHINEATEVGATK